MNNQADPTSSRQPPSQGHSTAAASPTNSHQHDLTPSLGLFTLLMLVIGGVIGSGIFRKPGVMAAQLGSPEWLLVVWVVAGLITFLGALTNAEAATMFPETGGQYVFFQKMYGPFFAFLYGWAALFVFQTGSISAVAYVFAEYSQAFISLPGLSRDLASWTIYLPLIGDIQPLANFGVKSLAAAVVIFLTIINYFGVTLGKLVLNGFTLAKLAAMLALCLLVFAVGKGTSVTHFTQDLPDRKLSGLLFFAAFAAALQGAFWAYDGWNKITYVAGEIHSPRRNIPIALLAGMGVVTAVYLLMNVVYLYALPITAMSQSSLVAADVAAQQISSGAKWISLAVMLSTFGAANAIVLASARVYFSMGRHGVLPAAFGKIQPRFRSPSVALLVQGAWAVILIYSGTFDMLTDTLIFVSWLFYGMGALGVIVLRHKMPDHPRPFRVPLYPWVPVTFILFSAIFLILTVYNDFQLYAAARAANKPALLNTAFGLALVLLGTPIYLYYRRKR